MKFSYRLFMILVVCGFFQTSYSQVAEKNKTQISIQVKKNNPNFSLELNANPTTGYQWFLGRYDDRFVQPVRKVYEVENKKLVGSGGKERWFFKLKPQAFEVPKMVEIEMIYARPWALEDAGTKTFKIVTQP